MKNSSKIRTKSHSRVSSKHQLAAHHSTTTPKKRHSRRLSSKTNQHENQILNTTEVKEDEEEEEEIGEDDGDVGLPGSDILKKNKIVKLCQKITENFWETAWSICSERFYAGNAPCMVTLELRNTWLRIMEAEWLDQDDDLPSDMFTPDEPPMPLLFESPSTDSFFQSRLKTAEDESEATSVLGGGEPHATANMKNLHEKKDMEKTGKKGSLGKGKRFASKIPRKKDSKSIPLKRTTLVSGRQKDNVKKSSTRPKTAERNPPISPVPLSPKTDKIEQPETIPIIDPSLIDENNNNNDPSGCIPLPPPIEEKEPEVPWDVIFMSKYKDDFDDDVSLSISQEYRFLGVEPWSPSQCKLENCGVFKFIHETSTFAKQQAEHLQQFKMSMSMPSKVPLPMELPIQEVTESVVKDAVTATGLELKKGSILLDTLADSPAAERIVERIDNLLNADSDHVVDILLPQERPVWIAGSQEFNVHNSEFVEHFVKSDDKDKDTKSERKTSNDKKSKGHKSRSRINSKASGGNKSGNDKKDSISPSKSVGDGKTKSKSLRHSIVKQKSPLGEGKKATKTAKKPVAK